MAKRGFLSYECYKSKHDTSAVYQKQKNLYNKFMLDKSQKNDFINIADYDLDNYIICESMNVKLY